MRKIVAALAALLALFCGLVTSTAAAQDDRRAAGASVRASLVVRHVVSAGENLTSDDGLYGPGGIMQHYFGRHRSGDIARLRAYDGNRRAIRVARCDWPEDVPREERTALQECPDAYARYTIRRSVGMVIQIPLRWVPTRRLADVMDVTPGTVRDMRRIAAGITVPEGALPDADASMAADDPLADAPVVAAAETDADAESDADAPDMDFTVRPGTAGTDPPDAGTVVAALPGIIPDPPTGGSEGGGGSGTGTGTGSDTGGGNAVTAALLSRTGGGIGWSLFLLLGLGYVVQGGFAWRRRRTNARAEQERRSNPPTLIPDDNIVLVRKSRDSYRDANMVLEAEKADLERKFIEANNRAAAETKAADDARKDVERALKAIAVDLHAPDVAAEPAETLAARKREKLVAWSKSVRDLVQKLALATACRPDDHQGMAKSLQKVVETRISVPPSVPPPAVAKRLEEDRDKREARERRITELQTRVEELEKELTEYEIGRRKTPKEEWYEQTKVPDLEREKADLAQALEAARAEVQSLSQASADSINALSDERQQAVTELETKLNQARAEVQDKETALAAMGEVNLGLEKRIAELEEAVDDLSKSIVTGGQEAQEDGSALPREKTVVVRLDQVAGAPGSQPPITGESTHPGLGDGSGAVDATAAAPAPPRRPTLGFEELKKGRGDETTRVAIPHPPRPPSLAPLLEPEDEDEEEEGGDDTLRGLNGSGNGSSLPSHKQPVMCGCKREFRWDEWAAHAAGCPEADKMQVPGAPDVPPATEVRPKRKKRKDRRQAT